MICNFDRIAPGPHILPRRTSTRDGMLSAPAAELRILAPAGPERREEETAI